MVQAFINIGEASATKYCYLVSLHSKFSKNFEKIVNNRVQRNRLWFVIHDEVFNIHN